jgi:hypothetical protein
MHDDHPSRRFLRRPFWRDWVLSYVLIGIGAIVCDGSSPPQNVVGVFIFAGGIAIFLAALGHGLRNGFRR